MSANVPRPPSEKPKAAFPVALIALIGCVVALPFLVAVVGIVAAIAIPNFIKFQCRSKQSEARVNLTSLYIAEKAFYAENGWYTSDLEALNWQPSGSPIYLYGFSQGGPHEDDLPRGAIAPSGYDPE